MYKNLQTHIQTCRSSPPVNIVPSNFCTEIFIPKNICTLQENLRQDRQGCGREGIGGRAEELDQVRAEQVHH